MPLFPNLVGGVEFRERKPRYRGEPIYKRLDFVRPKTQAEDYDIVKTIYREPRSNNEQAVVEVAPPEPEPELPPRLTLQQWQHVEETRLQQHQARVREQQQREHQMRRQAAFEQWERHEAMRHAQWQQEQERMRMGGGGGGPPGPGQGHGGHPPPPPPPPPPVGQPMQIDNRRPPQIIDMTNQGMSDESSADEGATVVEIRPGRGGGRRRSRAPVAVYQQEDIYSDSSDDEPPTRRSRSRRRR